MNHIHLIRHGQASFGAENYDQLSELGKEQAATIGQYFLEQNIAIDRIIHGKMWRQHETAQIIAKNANFNKPLICHEGANEFDSENLIKHYLPRLAERSSELAALMSKGENWWEKGDNFEIFFRALVTLWQQDENCPFESWKMFQKRCRQCLSDIASGRSGTGANKEITKRGITILATSGGLISVIMQSILGTDNHSFMDMNLTINNTSISEIVWNHKNHDSILKEEISRPLLKNNNRLLTFNNITPLLLTKRKELVTRK